MDFIAPGPSDQYLVSLIKYRKFYFGCAPREFLIGNGLKASFRWVQDLIVTENVGYSIRYYAISLLE